MFMTILKSIGGSAIGYVLRYKWIVIAIAAGILMAGSYWQGYKYASGSCESDKRKALEELIKYQSKVQEENDKLNDAIIEDLRNQRQNTRITYEKVRDYVENNPDKFDCSIDSAGLQLWNGEAIEED